MLFKSREGMRVVYVSRILVFIESQAKSVSKGRNRSARDATC